MKKVELTVFQGRAGDHNDLAVPGAASIGSVLSHQLKLAPSRIGVPAPALNTDWIPELAAAMPALQAMSAQYDAIFKRGAVPITVLTRCAVALATLPVVAKYRPDACIVWLDAHADINTPETSVTGYLGGMAISGAAGLWNSGLGKGLNLGNVVLTGSRDVDPAEEAIITAGSIEVIQCNGEFAQRLKRAIAGRPVYIHLDCDVLNPGIVPTDYQIADGLSLDDLTMASEIIAESEIVGLEIAEFQNAWELEGPPASPQTLLDALVPIIEGIQRQSGPL